ncbi:streptomycin biosynthesis protein [Actinophytocola glycyrrhizae]|uniref:Streptomycin biosynthesis protein n=1 Tax=Actinophytocola glycyrrhizae TaxID=2044873 RepID=A0ABV9S8D3_9PSEU
MTSSAGPEFGDAVSMLPISDLVRSGSPRLDGENEEHIQRLAETDEPLPPIVVHWPSMLVIDGMHRLRAAELRGQTAIAVRFLDCGRNEIFVEMVRANVAHGLPLSLADRKAAAERVLTTHPHWSDRMIAVATGLAHKTVGRIRRAIAEHLPQATTRVGRDGHARPLGRGGRELAEEIVRRDPDASLRTVARAAGVSVGTVHAVRQEVNVHDAKAQAPRGSDRESVAELVRRADGPHRAAVPSGQWASMMRRLRADPSLRFTEAGRAVLQVFGSHSIADGGWRRLSESVPAHWAPSLAGLAHELAFAWQQFAAHLDEVAKCSGERLPGLRHEPPVT